MLNILSLFYSFDSSSAIFLDTLYLVLIASKLPPPCKYSIAFEYSGVLEFNKGLLSSGSTLPLERFASSSTACSPNRLAKV